MKQTGIGDWYRLKEAESVPSPRVLVAPDVVAENIDQAVKVAGAADRLRPHVKTHKSEAVTALHLDRGVRKFKCATIAEAEMLAKAGARDVLVAYQTVGPALTELHALATLYRGVTFSCLVDNVATARAVDAEGERNGVVLGVFIDLDVGMHRTGVSPGDAGDLARFVVEARWLQAMGIHAYDGHIHDQDYRERSVRAAETRTLAFALRDEARIDRCEVVLGGTPSFPCHAEVWEDGVSLSPGTYVYSDWGYASNYPDLPFRGAAVVFGRVISRGEGYFTIDVGSKAIAADPAQPRGVILNVPGAKAGPQSEEHWVFYGEKSPPVGTQAYVWPKHICPTIEHHDHVLLVESGLVTGRWAVDARGRGLRG